MFWIIGRLRVTYETCSHMEVRLNTEKVREKYAEKTQMVKCVYSIGLRIQPSVLASHRLGSRGRGVVSLAKHLYRQERTALGHSQAIPRYCWFSMSITPFKRDQNKTQNRSIHKVQNLGNERRYIQLFRERLSEKVHTKNSKGIVGCF